MKAKLCSIWILLSLASKASAAVISCVYCVNLMQAHPLRLLFDSAGECENWIVSDLSRYTGLQGECHRGKLVACVKGEVSSLENLSAHFNCPQEANCHNRPCPSLSNDE